MSLHTFQKFFYFYFCFQAMNAKKEMKSVISNALNRPTNNNVVPDDLCSVLQGLQQSEHVDFKNASDVLDSIIDLLFSGSQTVNSAGFSLAHKLCTRTDVRERLLNEIKSNGLTATNEPVCTNDLREMIYLDAVVKETLRLLPPVGGAYRSATESFELDVSFYLFLSLSFVIF